MKPCIRKELVKELAEIYPRGISKECHMLKASQNGLSYIPVKRDNLELIGHLGTQSDAYPFNLDLADDKRLFDLMEKPTSMLRTNLVLKETKRILGCCTKKCNKF